MNVKATALQDWKLHKAALMTIFYGRKNPRAVKAIIAAITAAAILLCGWLAVYGLKENDFAPVIMAAVYALMILFIACIFSVCHFPAKMLYDARTRFWTPEYSFEFGEESVKISAAVVNKDNERADNGSLNLDYLQLKRAFECSEYIFITLPSGQNIGFNKACIENGTSEDIRNKLQAALGRKYKTANY